MHLAINIPHTVQFKPLIAKLNTIRHLLALVRAHHILHVSGVRVKQNDYRSGNVHYTITVEVSVKTCL